MAANQRPAANPVYENFEPTTEWSREPTAEVLLLFLPGFKREQLKVQVTSTSKLRISGEREIGIDKRSRFEKELQIPSNCNTNEISAKFDRGSLSIRLPKNIAPAETEKLIAEAPKPQEQLPKQHLKPKPESPIQAPRESVPKPQKPTNDQKPEAPKNMKQEEAVVQEAAVPKTSIDKPKIENNVPKKAAAEEEKKESPSDHGKEKSSVVDSIDNKNAAKVDKTTGGIVGGSGKPALVQDYKQVLGGFMVKMKKPKNLVVVVVLIAVIVLSANRAIKSLVKFKTNEASSSDYQA
ncbi:heat shock family protein [Tripterygium wilfordii]|uniref:Heat shock family protein n=1 Tax=Tripterygium wilfordii TaxID=458696 RepID=A0A7J7C0C4_TRIWF|nr:inactive protein RESTRICTED TEV MOVEMENT 2-like [Tripterygium wilfordii]KAF5727552.1 heat shock family protein [Tripterygium wilfordii]